LRWRIRSNAPLWSSLRGNSARIRSFDTSRSINSRRTFSSRDEVLCAARDGITVTGVNDEVGVRSLGYSFLLPNRKITTLLVGYISQVDGGKRDPFVLVALNLVFNEWLNSESPKERPREKILRLLSEQGRFDLDSEDFETTILSSEFIDTVEETN